MSDRFTPKQARFVDEYLVDLNATQAAIRAGYSAKMAGRIGQNLVAKSHIARAIAERRQARTERVEIQQDDVLRELAAMGMYDPADIASANISGPTDIAKLPESTRRAIIGWSWDRQGNFVLKLSPKTPSLELLGRHLGMWKDEVTHKGQVALQTIAGASLDSLSPAALDAIESAHAALRSAGVIEPQK